MKFKQLDEPIYTTEPMYDLIHGGYIDPHKMLESEADAQEVVEAIQVIEAFLCLAEEEGVLEVG
jgi:hypothetical protein